MTNVFRLDQETLSRVYEEVNRPGDMGSKHFVEDKIIEFAVYNNDRVTYVLAEYFNLIEPEEMLEFLETAGTVYFELEK